MAGSTLDAALNPGAGDTNNADQDQNQDAGSELNQDQDPTDSSNDAADKKEESRTAFLLRQLQKEVGELRKENEGYKRRADDIRKASLTEEQRLKEDNDALSREVERMKLQALQQKIAAEFRLPASLAVRLIGTDEEAMRADAEELAKYVPRPKSPGGPTNPDKGNAGSKPTFSRTQLRDPAFYKANEAAIKEAAKEGRITND